MSPKERHPRIRALGRASSTIPGRHSQWLYAEIRVANVVRQLGATMALTSRKQTSPSIRHRGSKDGAAPNKPPPSPPPPRSRGSRFPSQITGRGGDVIPRPIAPRKVEASRFRAAQGGLRFTRRDRRTLLAAAKCARSAQYTPAPHVGAEHRWNGTPRSQSSVGPVEPGQRASHSRLTGWVFHERTVDVRGRNVNRARPGPGGHSFFQSRVP